MRYSQYEDLKDMSLSDLYMQKDDISFQMVEAEGNDVELLEEKLEEVEELITLKEAGLEELDFN